MKIAALVALLAAAEPDGGIRVGSGNLSIEELRDVIQAARPAIRRCFDARRGSKDAYGKLLVRFVIGADGVVSAAERHDLSTLSDAPVSDCVLAVVKRLKFPPPRGGGTVSVTYPFFFERADGGS